MKPFTRVGSLINNRGSLGFEFLRDTLDGRLSEVIRIGFHGKSVYTDSDVLFSVAFNNCLDQISGTS